MTSIKKDKKNKNLKQLTFKGKNLKQFTFKDWRRGKVQGNIEPGKKLVTTDTGKSRYEEISLIVFNEIKAEWKKFYDKEVDSTLEHKKKEFKKLLNQSGNRKRLINKEIKQINRRFTQKIKTTNIVENFKDLRLKQYQAIYDKIITNGLKDYSIIRVSPINTNVMIDYRKEILSLEKRKRPGEARDKATTEDQIASLNRRIKLLQEYCSTEHVLQVDPSFRDYINVEADVKYKEWLEKLSISNTRISASIKDNLNHKHPINKLFKEDALVALLDKLYKAGLITVDYKSNPWKFRFTPNDPNKNLMLGALFAYLVNQTQYMNINIRQDLSRDAFNNFFECTCSRTQFGLNKRNLERYKSKYYPTFVQIFSL